MKDSIMFTVFSKREGSGCRSKQKYRLSKLSVFFNLLLWDKISNTQNCVFVTQKMLCIFSIMIAVRSV